MTGTVCPRCGAAFGCGAAADTCWCAAEPLSKDAAARAREYGETCLCPACLAEIAR